MHPRRPSLRTQLLLVVLGLLAVMGATVGVVTDVALKHFLTGRLDSQLESTAVRGGTFVGGDFFGRGDGPNPVGQAGQPSGAPGQAGSGSGAGANTASGGPDPKGLLRAPGTAPGTVYAIVATDGTVSASRLADGATAMIVSVTTADDAALVRVPVDGSAHTVTLGSLGSYRVRAVKDGDGDHRAIVAGLPLNDVNATVVRLSLVSIAVTAIGLVLAAIAALLLLRLTLRPLRRVAHTAQRVAELPLDRGEVLLAERVPAADTDHRTEVGLVGAALNTLLGAVESALAARQASETKVRQFVADASHELRTPLAAIRGYAELTRRSREPVPPDIAHALARVESEAVRMTSLVDDLLLLARLDAGRPLRDDEVDLTSLLLDTVSDARATAPDHRWQLDLPDSPVLVRGDAQRLHQVLANLLANARTHTPAGTTVTASVKARADGAALLAIVDDGPGIPEALQPSVFERFARGDSSRSRAAGSTGLGLAIVAAVVHAHGGTVDLSSRPGQTAFLVRLPAHVPAELPQPALSQG